MLFIIKDGGNDMSIFKELLRCIAPKLYYSIMSDEELKEKIDGIL